VPESFPYGITLSQQLDKLLMDLSHKARGMFFDVVSVLEGQPYSEALAFWTAATTPIDSPADVAAVQADFGQLGSKGLVVRDHTGRLTVPDAVLEVGRQFLCSQQKATQYGFNVGSRVWLQQDGRLPADLDKALQVRQYYWRVSLCCMGGGQLQVVCRDCFRKASNAAVIELLIFPFLPL